MSKRDVTTEPESWRVLQMRNVVPEGVGFMDLPRVEKGKAGPEDVLLGNEVLLVSRGMNNKAALMPVGCADVVAGGQLYVIRLRGDEVLPDYLVWWLNAGPGLSELETVRTGSHIPFVRGQALSELAVTVPPLGVQRRIANLYRLSLEEGMLLKAIREKRREWVTGTLQTLVREGDGGNRRSEIEDGTLRRDAEADPRDAGATPDTKEKQGFDE